MYISVFIGLHCCHISEVCGRSNYNQLTAAKEINALAKDKSAVRLHYSEQAQKYVSFTTWDVRQLSEIKGACFKVGLNALQCRKSQSTIIQVAYISLALLLIVTQRIRTTKLP